VTTGFVTVGVSLTLKRLDGRPITEEELNDYVPEGAEATFDFAGPAARVLTQLVGGIRSGMSYSGSMSLEQLHEKAEFIRVTSAGQLEGTPHACLRTEQLDTNYQERFLAEAVEDKAEEGLE
jgi:IMP dehydrogenase/GMP reductase